MDMGRIQGEMEVREYVGIPVLFVTGRLINIHTVVLLSETWFIPVSYYKTRLSCLPFESDYCTRNYAREFHVHHCVHSHQGKMLV